MKLSSIHRGTTGRKDYQPQLIFPSDFSLAFPLTFRHSSQHTLSLLIPRHSLLFISSSHLSPLTLNVHFLVTGDTTDDGGCWDPVGGARSEEYIGCCVYCPCQTCNWFHDLKNRREVGCITFSFLWFLSSNWQRFSQSMLLLHSTAPVVHSPVGYQGMTQSKPARLTQQWRRLNTDDENCFWLYNSLAFALPWLSSALGKWTTCYKESIHDTKKAATPCC